VYLSSDVFLCKTAVKQCQEGLGKFVKILKLLARGKINLVDLFENILSRKINLNASVPIEKVV
jgi:hypothetical protein